MSETVDAQDVLSLSKREGFLAKLETKWFCPGQ